MATVKVNMASPQKILLKRYLNPNGQAQQKFTQECFKEMNPYVPYDTGRLKDWMIKVNVDNVTYNSPYAKRQYYTNIGNGKQGMNTGGIRGKQWAPRMWSSKGDGIVKTIAEFVGGRVK